MEKGKGHRLIIANDGGTLVGPTLEAPIGAEGLARLTIDPLVDTQVDTLVWQLGSDLSSGGNPTCRFSDNYSHDTSVGPRWGADTEKFTSAGNWRIYENTESLIAAGTDPPAVVIEHGHKAGLEVFLGMRVNDIHDGIPPDKISLLSPMKNEHRDWLLGTTGKPSHGYHPSTTMSRYAYNFAIPEVRAYKLALAREAIANYNLDGLDWDFCRHPRLFPQGTGEENAHLLTDIMRQLRADLDKKSEEAGRKLYLSVRVPSRFDLALSFGMDVKTWLEEGLIDMLVAGSVFGAMQRLPLGEYLEATKDRDVQLIAHIGVSATSRPRSARVIWGERDYHSDEMYRAMAADYWRAGVDGIYLWNNHLIEFGQDAGFDHRPWKEIADPKLIERKDKHYLVDHPMSWQGVANDLDAPPIPEGPLPAELKEAGASARIPIDVADDLTSTSRDGDLKEVTLRLMITNLTSLDTLEFDLNGEPLDPTSARTRLLYNDCWLDFEPSPSILRQGWNQLEVRVKARNPHISAALSLESVEVIVRYERDRLPVEEGSDET